MAVTSQVLKLSKEDFEAGFGDSMVGVPEELRRRTSKPEEDALRAKLISFIQV